MGNFFFQVAIVAVRWFRAIRSVGRAYCIAHVHNIVSKKNHWRILSTFVAFCRLDAPCAFFSVYFSRLARLLSSTFVYFTCIRVVFFRRRNYEKKDISGRG